MWSRTRLSCVFRQPRLLSGLQRCQCRTASVDSTVTANSTVTASTTVTASSLLNQLEPTETVADVTGNDEIKDPLLEPDFFKVKDLISVRDMFGARTHYGHKSGCRNPYMTPFLFGSRNDIDIFDLEKTATHFATALNFLSHIVYRGGVILFVSRQKETMTNVEELAETCGEYAHCRYWPPGTFTDSAKHFGCVTRLPDVCVFLNTLNSAFQQHIGILECAKMLIPTVGVVDSNCDPRFVTYPIPGCDDNDLAIKLYIKYIRNTILKAKEMREAASLDVKRSSRADVVNK